MQKRIRIPYCDGPTKHKIKISDNKQSQYYAYKRCFNFCIHLNIMWPFTIREKPTVVVLVVYIGTFLYFL